MENEEDAGRIQEKVTTSSVAGAYGWMHPSI
jgi:hypothetical protein